jgi:Pyoverdine/dityrosine biosynthesis protein
MATLLAAPSSSSAVAEAHKCLSPLLSPPDGSEAFYGRRYENLGATDRLRAIADGATSDLEGLPLRDSLGCDVDTALARVTPQWIEDQVESAILQSTPERVMTELATRGAAHDLIFTPPAPVGQLRVPALTLRPLIDAVDADARRLAYDPAQQDLRAQALFATDHHGQTLNRAVAMRIADEAGEHGRLVRDTGLDVKGRRRLEDLERDHRRRRRYAKAFALAVRSLSAEARHVSIPQLVHVFDAIAGLDKIPFRRGPSEHLTAEFLASMAREFYLALDDPERVVTFLLLTFPIKNSSGLRTNVATEAADFGELLMLAQLRRLLQFLKELGWPNVRFVCLADGIVYGKYLGPYPRTLPVFYRENVRQFRDALGLAGRVVIVDAEQLLCRIPGFDAALVAMRTVLDRAEAERPRVREKIGSLIRSFLFHIRGYDEDVSVLTKVVNACLQGRELETAGQKAEQRRIWQKAAADARWYATHLLLMSALDVVRGLVAVPYIRATVHPKPGQFAPAPVNVRDFTDLPYQRKPLLRARANPLNLDTYLGVNLWADPSLRFVDVFVGANRSPFLGIQV